MIKLREMALFCVVFCAFAFCGDILDQASSKLPSLGARTPQGFPIPGTLVGKNLVYESQSISSKPASLSLTIQIQVSREEASAFKSLLKAPEDPKITELKRKVLDFFAIGDGYDVKSLKPKDRTNIISIELVKMPDNPKKQ